MLTKTLFPTVLLFVSAVFGAGIRMPPFSGKFPVGTVSFPLKDESRDDPLATSPQKRRVMVQLFYPTTSDASSKYPPAPFAPDNTLQAIASLLNMPNGTTFGDLITGASDRSPVNYGATSPYSRINRNCDAAYSKSDSGGPAARKLPLVFFSHGLNSIRFASEYTVADLASHGYLVAAVDHPFDALVVEFPGGDLVTVNPDLNSFALPDGADIDTIANKVLAVRVADIEFIKKTFLSGSFSVPGLNGESARLRIDESRIGMFGHSLGGAAAAEIMLGDKKFAAGANLDGSFFGKTNTSATDVDLKRPFMIMNAPDHKPKDDPSYVKFLKAQKKFKTPVVTIQGTVHISFADIGLLFDTLKLERSILPEVFGVGTISGDRMTKCQTGYISSFFDKSLKGHDNGLLDKATNEEYPEVAVQNL